MSDLIIKKKNESTLHITCSNRISGELSNFFSAYADNYKWMPKFKNGIWDGKIRVYDSVNNTLPIGLLYMLHRFCKRGKYTFDQDFKIGCFVDRSEFEKFVSSLNISFDIRDYQLQAAYDAITKQHLNISSSTSSGKSLLIYIIIRWMIKENKKVLLVCPSTQLVEQMFSDFYSYGWNEVEDKVCMIYSGQERLVHRPVQISTWQSVYTKKDEELLSTYNCMILDENHGASANAKAVTNLAKNCINASYRIGLSGSFPNEGTADWLTVTGVTGTIAVYSTYKTLQEEGYIADFKIIPVILSYPMNIRMKTYQIGVTDDEITETEKYNLESDFVNSLECRNKFITKLVSNLKGNTLILFKKKELHGIPLYEYIKEIVKDKKIVYIDGDVSVKDREAIRDMMEKRDDVVLVASLGTTSTGISIKNLHNLIFAVGTKSKIKTIQSIGRILRLNHNKDKVLVFDIVDDMRIKDTKAKIFFKNYSYKHYQERLKIYADNNFEVEVKEYTVKDSKQ